MIKKISYSFLFFLSVQFVLFSCCKPRSFNAYLQSLDFDVYEQQLGFTQDPIANEDLSLRVESRLQLVEVSSLIDTKSLLNTANATSCPDDNILYLSRFIALEMTANTDVLGITAGNSLNDKLRFFIVDDTNLQELSNLTDLNNEDSPYEYFFLKFIDDLPSGTTLELTIIVTSELGQEFTATTEIFTIE